MRILFTGGGTGGHVFPIIAVIRELKKIAEEERIVALELYYMGPADFGADTFKEEDIMLVSIFTGKMRRYVSFANVIDFFKTAIGFFQALWNMFLIMPDVVFSKGGYGAFPAVASAIIFRIPLIIHESDSVPGRVNRFSAQFATRIGAAFATAETFFPKQKTALVGVPIRKRILGGRRNAAREQLGIFTKLPAVAIIGASLGARKINDATLGVLKELTEEFEVIHQTGAAHIKEIREEAKVILEFSHKERYHAIGFFDERGIRDFYQASDIVVSRAGASSIYEIAAWGKPSILIPLRNAAQDHQRKNAYEYASAGACLVIEEDNLSPHILLAEIRKLMQNPEGMKKMGEAAQRFARIDSGEIIAREILKLGIH
ncbi:MAG: hypothetical protein G01um101433_543 [Parcubacteria group bacterium Gr01-1014_33]|nr:MAG: hypothetical protein G01um101433_543 [Parcubacteria group bacterium Gr01-1014_33]